MTIKNEKDFPLCKDCYFSDIDYEYRKSSIKCCNCQLNYSFEKLKKEVFESKIITKIMLPIVKKINRLLVFINKQLRGR